MMRKFKAPIFLCLDCGAETKRKSVVQKRCEICAANAKRAARSDWRKRPENAESVVASAARYRAKPEKKVLIKRLIAKWQKKPENRYKSLKKKLLVERVSEKDLLWSYNFYFQLIQDSQCHYCLGPLSEYGHGLDRVDNGLGHIASNVVPCCGNCNMVKNHYFSYDEMIMLASVLREIRLKRNNEEAK